MIFKEIRTLHDCCAPDFEFPDNAHKDNPVIRIHCHSDNKGEEYYALQICTCSCHREQLGRLVREAWVNWAQLQVNPKPTWLTKYEELSESDKEADRKIGEHLFRRFIEWLIGSEG